ncbi:hypothetical protein PTTG_03468 [Puccinia triticina 1-1 BBBD Race 1]|uniref:HbrB-like protein n=1 Tax=Puccinia triticina (isolate 1-1 / race 1 (BBBD)) TaxID=630390 RepID=A0A180GU16_PUCT1|nr:hypothetical protein PTTG_03468 [Puccinia triticina 1-1 BBBD Race 1]
MAAAREPSQAQAPADTQSRSTATTRKHRTADSTHYIPHSAAAKRSQQQQHNRTTAATATAATATATTTTTTTATTTTAATPTTTTTTNLFTFSRPDFLKRITTTNTAGTPSHSPTATAPSQTTDHEPSSPPPEPRQHKKDSSISSLTGIGLSSIGFLVNSAASLAHPNPTSSSHPAMNFSATNKPVIRHITSSSTLASISNNQSLLSLPKPDPNATPAETTGHNLSGLILKPGDVWSQVILRVIPLFNGEGHKGFIEDLNDFVSQHIHKTIADSPSKSIIKLHADITQLLANGVMILNNKLQPDQLSDERLLVRVFEVWHFFFTGVLPYLEAIFLPLMSDENLLNMIESKNNKVLQERLQQQHLLQQATTNASLFSSTSSSLLFRQSNRAHPPTSQPPKNRSTGSPNPRTDHQDVIQGIDIRRLALIAFREHLIAPIHPRLYKLFAILYDPTACPPSSLPALAIGPHSSEHMHLKRLQMVGLLCSVQTDDARQSMMAEFSKLIRLKKANPDLLLKLSSNNTIRNIPPRTASANPNNAAASPGSNRDLLLRDRNPHARDRSQSSSSSHSHSHSHSRSSPPQQQTPRQSTSASTTTITSNLKLHPEEYDDDRPLVNLLDDEGDAQHIKGWNKNRDFARRSIRRQLGRNGSAIRRMSRANNDENFVQQPAVPTHSMRRPERVQRNRAIHLPPSVPRNLMEEGTPDSSPAYPNGSPPRATTPPTTTATFWSQSAGRESLDDDEQPLEYLSDRVHPYHYSQPDFKESGQRSRAQYGGTFKTGSASSNGSALSVLLPPPTTAPATAGHSSRGHTLPASSTAPTTKADELDGSSQHDAHPASKLASSIQRIAPAASTQPLRSLHHHPHHLHHPHQQQQQQHHHHLQQHQQAQQPHHHHQQLNLSIEPLKLSHYRSRSSSNLSKDSPSHQVFNLHHHQQQQQQQQQQQREQHQQQHLLQQHQLSSSLSSSTGPPTPHF